MRFITSIITRCFGAGRAMEPMVISATARLAVKEHQVKTVLSLAPAMMVANLVVMVLLITMMKDSQSEPSFAVWSTIFMVAVGISLLSWWRWRKNLGDPLPTEKLATRILLAAVVFGCLWGILPSLVMVGGNSLPWFYVGVAIVAVVLGAGFSLATIPQAMLGFMVPLFINSSITFFQSGILAGALLVTLLVVFAGIMLMTSATYSQSLLERIQTKEKYENQEAVIGLLLKDFEEMSSDWLWETDTDNRIINASTRFATAAGQSVDELNGKKITNIAVAKSEELTLTVSAFVESVRNKITFRDLNIPVMFNDEQKWWSITGVPSHDVDGEFCGFKGVCSDISVQRKSEEKVKFLAHNDALTGLVNRTQFTEQLNQYVVRLERYGTPFSVLYVDLDRFKTVNDTKGHPVGDHLLMQVGKRLRKEVRDADVLARIGGDEFAILCGKSTQQNNCEANLAKRIIEALSAPFEIFGETVVIGASIGIAMAPRNGTRPDQILRNADLALYRAKDAGRGVYQFFKAEMDYDARERRALEFELREALQNNEFELNYQPLMDVTTKLPTGFEALIRWRHPIRDIISPAEFIPLAEKIGLINSIGEWVINEACRTAVTWPKEYTIAVNLSAHQFENEHILDVVRNALEATGLEAGRLELEVTESLLIDHPEEVIETLQKLKKLGVAIAMDDFGTGYSSLSYLMKFPFDKMKIDRSFVMALDTDAAARDILKTIGSLGESLNMKITVEGVETSEQVEFLSSMSCHQLQGFYFAKPLKEDELAAYMLKGVEAAVTDKQAA